MKKICYVLMLTLLCALVPRTQAQVGVQVPVFDTRDFLDSGDLFYPEDGATIYWQGGALGVEWNGQDLVVSERVDRFGRLEFFASPDPDGEDGVLPSDFVCMEGYISINNLGLPKLTIDAVFDDRVHAQRINTVYDRNGNTIFMGQLCECSDQIDLACKSPNCNRGTACGGGSYKCYWKPVKDPPETGDASSVGSFDPDG